MNGTPPLFLCVGDLDVDVLVGVDRLPGRDGKVNGTRLQRVPGGMAGNAAMAMARLGGSVRVVGRVGCDDDGAFALAGLEEAGIDTRHVARVAGVDTFSCIALLTPDGEKSLIKLLTPAYLPDRDDLPDRVFYGVRHVHLTFGRDPGVCRHVAVSAAQVGASVSLDMELADLPADAEQICRSLKGFDILFCNVECRAVVDQLIGEQTLRSIVPTVVTTLGAAGAKVETGGEAFEVPGIRVEAKDTTGAGDCFAAAFLHARLVQELNWTGALRFANAAAALSTLGFGAQSALPSSAEIKAHLETL